MRLDGYRARQSLVGVHTVQIPTSRMCSALYSTYVLWDAEICTVCTQYYRTPIIAIAISHTYMVITYKAKYT